MLVVAADMHYVSITLRVGRAAEGGVAMENERNLRWHLQADDVRHFRTCLTNALLAAGQLSRKHARTDDAQRLHAHLSTALKHLVTRLRQIEQRARGDGAR